MTNKKGLPAVFMDEAQRLEVASVLARIVEDLEIDDILRLVRYAARLRAGLGE